MRSPNDKYYQSLSHFLNLSTSQPSTTLTSCTLTTISLSNSQSPASTFSGHVIIYVSCAEGQTSVIRRGCAVILHPSTLFSFPPRPRKPRTRIQFASDVSRRTTSAHWVRSDRGVYPTLRPHDVAPYGPLICLCAFRDAIKRPSAISRTGSLSGLSLLSKRVTEFLPQQRVAHSWRPYLPA